MTTINTQVRFALAGDAVGKAVMELVRLRTSYENSDHPDRKARVRALTAKVNALQAVVADLNPNAHPWVGDWKVA